MKNEDNLKFENMLLNRIMETTSIGIIAVDGNKKILFFNSSAKEIFDLTDLMKLDGIKFIEIIRNYTINVYIDNCLKQNLASSHEVYYFSSEQKQLQMSFHPFELNSSTGCIIYVQDITSIKKLEQIRTEFVSNVTHELKTPLTSIRGFVETLRSGAINDLSVANSFLEIIDIESERLSTLINDILQLSEIETGHKEDSISSISVLKTVEDVFEMLTPAASRKNITLHKEISSDICLDVNPYRLKQLIINLVDNSIKYNKDNGYVMVSSTETIGKISICVKDSGIGIPPEHQERIFERFYTVDKSRSRKLGGTGLGLSIVKHIVNLYGGNIYLSSEPNKGTRFVIEFPVLKLS